MDANPLLDLFRNYNPDVWPLPVIAYALGIGALALVARRPSRGTDRLVVGLLALEWLWLGVVFQGLYVSEVDATAGVLYAALFIVQAVLLAWYGILGDRIAFQPATNTATVVGITAIVYALVVYPLLGIALGHPYPEAPLFGAAPCPTTIVTFGLFLMARPPFPKPLLAVPLLWAIVAPLAAVQRGVLEDVALFVVGVVAVALVIVRDRRPRAVSRQVPEAA